MVFDPAGSTPGCAWRQGEVDKAKDRVECPLGEIPAGGSKPFSVRAKVTDRVPMGKELETKAEARASNLPDYGEDYEDYEGRTTSAVLGFTEYEADLSLEATASPAEAAPGDKITYRVRPINNGPSSRVLPNLFIRPDPALRDVTAKVVPGNGDNDECNATDGGEGHGDKYVKCWRVNPKRGDVVEVTGTVGPTDAQSLASSFRIYNEEDGESPPDPNNTNDTVTVNTKVAKDQTDLAITGKGPSTATPGKSTASYAFAVTNKGGRAARGSKLAINVPKGLMNVTAKGCTVKGSTATGTTATCNLGDLAGGATKKITLSGKVRPDAAGTLTVTGKASSSTPEASTADNAATVRTATKPGADLKVTGSVGKLKKGKTGTYSFSVSNRGPATARNVTVTARLPKGLSIKSVSGRGCKRSGNGIRCAVSSLAPGKTAKISVRVKVAKKAKGKPAYKVTVSSATYDPYRANNSTTVRRGVTKH
jgi:uncharacterized repeat protein (TIGR01451 family)